jgi:hypothetical protein
MGVVASIEFLGSNMANPAIKRSVAVAGWFERLGGSLGGGGGRWAVQCDGRREAPPMYLNLCPPPSPSRLSFFAGARLPT